MGHYELPPSVSIPYGDIDAEHQGLLDVLNDALRMLSSVDEILPVHSSPLLQTLRAQLKDHFQHEEQIMEELGYPDVARHSLHHLSCARQLDYVCEDIAAGRRPVNRELVDDLFDTILEDIIRADTGFKSFLQNKNLCVVK